MNRHTATYLRASLGTVHDGVAAVHREGVSQLLEPLLRVFVSRINDPAVRLHQHCWTQVLVSIPPVRGTRSGAAGTQDALI